MALAGHEKKGREEMKGLTARQKEVLEFIKKFKIEKGYSPTLTEIGDFFGQTSKSAHDHIAALEKKNYIKKTSGKARTISILTGLEQ